MSYRIVKRADSLSILKTGDLRREKWGGSYLSTASTSISSAILHKTHQNTNGVGRLMKIIKLNIRAKITSTTQQIPIHVLLEVTTLSIIHTMAPVSTITFRM